eukprot:6131502-Ditylum_brightwellii.AAC.1
MVTIASTNLIVHGWRTVMEEKGMVEYQAIPLDETTQKGKVEKWMADPPASPLHSLFIWFWRCGGDAMDTVTTLFHLAVQTLSVQMRHKSIHQSGMVKPPAPPVIPGNQDALSGAT